MIDGDFMNRRLVIKKKSIMFFMLMLCVTAFYGTNYWYTNIYIYDFMIITSCLLSIIVFVCNGIRIDKTYYKGTIILSIVMWFSGLIAAQGKGLPAIVIFKESLYTITPIMIFLAFRPMIKSIKDTSLFLRTISAAGVICNLIACIEMFFAKRGFDFLNISVFEKLRNGTPRFIIGETIIVLSFFISCSIVFSKGGKRNRRIFHVLNIVLTAINLVYIIKTRTLNLYILSTLMMIPVFKKNIKKKLKFLVVFLISIIITFVSAEYFIPIVKNLIHSDHGVQIRFFTIEYYIEYFKTHYLLGAGYISSSPYYETHSIVTGPLGRYYPSDVGLIGLMFRSGIIGLIWLISWFYTSLKIIKDNTIRIPAQYDLLMKLVIVFLMFSCINLIITDAPRFPYIALVMLLFESSYTLSYENSSN